MISSLELGLGATENSLEVRPPYVEDCSIA